MIMFSNGANGRISAPSRANVNPTATTGPLPGNTPDRGYASVVMGRVGVVRVPTLNGVGNGGAATADGDRDGIVLM
jgi:hypothetical protein